MPEHPLPRGARSYLRQTQQELHQTAREAHVYLGTSPEALRGRQKAPPESSGFPFSCQ